MKTFLEILKIILTLIGLGIVGIVGLSAWLWLPIILSCVLHAGPIIVGIGMLISIPLVVATQLFVEAKFESL